MKNIFIFKRKKIQFDDKTSMAAQDMRIDPQFTPEEEYDLNSRRLAKITEGLPLGVVIQRVQPKQAGNKWAAYYRTPGFGKYYGKTLLECVLKLRADERVSRKMEENLNKIIQKEVEKGTSGLL